MAECPLLRVGRHRHWKICGYIRFGNFNPISENMMSNKTFTISLSVPDMEFIPISDSQMSKHSTVCPPVEKLLCVKLTGQFSSLYSCWSCYCCWRHCCCWRPSCCWRPFCSWCPCSCWRHCCCCLHRFWWRLCVSAMAGSFAAVTILILLFSLLLFHGVSVVVSAVFLWLF
jgi:hypothetical protein